MKIAHLGSFLAEGFRQIKGVELLPFSSFSHQIESESFSAFEKFSGQVDLIVIEFVGKFPWPEEDLTVLQECSVPVAVYAVDSTINIYYYKYLLRFFDYVFVDQQSSVKELEGFGIKAHWLPLCAQESDFRHAQAKSLGLSFVGRTSEERLKRGYLLSQLFENFPQKEDFQIFQDLSESEMQDIFASSVAVLNENLFNGLTLRVLQALASGSVLLTEEQMDGMDLYFNDKEDLLYYTPQNLVPLVHDILENPDKYKEIARQGQEKCWKFHRSYVRAKELLEVIFQANQLHSMDKDLLPEEAFSLKKMSFYSKEMETPLFSRCNATEQNLAQKSQNIYFQMLFDNANSIFRFAEVHGGNYQKSIQFFTFIIDNSKNIMLIAEAQCALGYIFAQTVTSGNMGFQKAEQYYIKALGLLMAEQECKEKRMLEIKILSQLSVLYIIQNKLSKAFWANNQAKEVILANGVSGQDNIITIFPKVVSFERVDEQNIIKIKAQIYFSLAQVQASIGNIIEPGHNKINSTLPTSAVHLALKAWRISKHSAILDFILFHLSQRGLAGQLIPEFLKAIKENKVSRSQKEQIKNIAKNYFYNVDTLDF